MNAKQRKIAERIRERALLDSDAKLQKIETLQRELAAEKAKFEDYKAKFSEHVLAELQKVQKERDDFRIHQQKVQYDWLKTTNRLQDVNVIREVLLQLELDEDPIQIALNIRKQFGMIIPEW